MKEVIKTENTPEPVGPYSKALKVNKFLFVSCQVAIDLKEDRIVATGIREQTARVMENIKAILKAAGYTLNDVVQSNVYLSLMAMLSEFNNEYAKYFDKGFPTRATVGVELMPATLLDISLDISVVAYRD